MSRTNTTEDPGSSEVHHNARIDSDYSPAAPSSLNTAPGDVNAKEQHTQESSAKRTEDAQKRPALRSSRSFASRSYMGEPLANLTHALSYSGHSQRAVDEIELTRVVSRKSYREEPSDLPEIDESSLSEGLSEEAGSPIHPIHQGIPPELGSLTKELIFIFVCSSGQLLWCFYYGDVIVCQQAFQRALALKSTELPWLAGSVSIALALSVIVSGSITDLTPPKQAIVAALVWQTIWNIIGAFSITPPRRILFFFMRAMQGLSTGVLVSGSISVLGRVYKPGQRKTRVFSAMAAGAPFGFWLGALQGGALSAHLPWIFGTNAMLAAALCAGSIFTIPPLRPAADKAGAEAPSLRQFDFKGAACALVGCICLLFGLTQGPVTQWSPYTYSLIIVGFLVLGLFFWIETRVSRPMLPPMLWKIPGFAPLIAAYFVGFGGFIGAWQFYAVQFFLNIQHKSAIIVALYLLPNAIMGVLATFVVSRLLHIVPGHYIYIASMLAFALGPAFFLPQNAGTTYWALSMPGIGLATFGPDLSFAAASIFITSNVSRSYQGSAGSLLVTVQNLSTAIMTSVADAIGAKVDMQANGEIGLEGLKAAWWFSLAAALTGAVITAVAVRIPKEEEKEHVT